MALIDTKKMVVVLALVIFAGVKGFAEGQQSAPAQATEASPKVETLEARLEKMKGLKQGSTATAESVASGAQKTPDQIQEDVQQRAEQIRNDKARAKILAENAKRDDSVMRKARKDLQDEVDKREKFEKEKASDLLKSQLSGCDPDTVGIKNLRQRFDVMAIFPSTVHVSVLNEGPTAVSFDVSFRGYADIVTNLCSGGLIVLTFKLGKLEPGQWVPIRARTTLPDGSRRSQEMWAFLQTNGQWQFVDNRLWTVNLR